jgi:ubiquitin-protein ligase E3 D
MEDSLAEGLRLYKDNIAARQLAEEPPVYETYAVDVITSAQLLDLVDHEGVRRFVIHAGQSDGMLVSTPIHDTKKKEKEKKKLIKLAMGI